MQEVYQYESYGAPADVLKKASIPIPTTWPCPPGRWPASPPPSPSSRPLVSPSLASPPTMGCTTRAGSRLARRCSYWRPAAASAATRTAPRRETQTTPTSRRMGRLCRSVGTRPRGTARWALHARRAACRCHHTPALEEAGSETPHTTP